MVFEVSAQREHTIASEQIQGLYHHRYIRSRDKFYDELYNDIHSYAYACIHAYIHYIYTCSYAL